MDLKNCLSKTKRKKGNKREELEMAMGAIMRKGERKGIRKNVS